MCSWPRPFSRLLRRFSWLRSPAGVFRSSASPPASLWLSLLGVLLRWLNLFLTTACDCGLSCSDSTDLRIVWFSRLRCQCHRGVSATSCSTLSSSPLFRCVSLPGVSRPPLWSECFQVFSPRSWVGVPILTVRSLQACVTGVGCVFCQRQGTVGRPAMSSPVPVPSPWSHSRCLLRPRHCGGASPRGWRLEVSSPPLFGSGTLPLAGVFFHPPGSTFSFGLLPYPR